MNREEKPVAKLMEEHFEHNNEFGTVKYTGKFMLDNLDKVFAKGNLMAMFEETQQILPNCFNECLGKMFTHGQENGIKPTEIGFILHSVKIPFGGEICEPIKPNVDLNDLIEQIQDKLGNLDVDLKGVPFVVIVNGVQKGPLEKSNAKKEEAENKVNDDGKNKEEELEQNSPGAVLVHERFEQNAKFRLVKYIGQFNIVDSIDAIYTEEMRKNGNYADKMKGIAQKMCRKCFRECLQKMLAHGAKHEIKPNRIGFIVESPEIPSGEICEPIKPNADFDSLIDRIQSKLANLNVTLEMLPFLVKVTGTEL